MLPGIPMLPFLALGGGAAYLAVSARKRNRATKEAEAIEAAAPAAAAAASAAAEEPISTALKIDDLKIELGYALLPLVNGPDGTDRLTEQIKALRRSLAVEMGFVMPAVRILDNVQLEANTYIIKIKEVDAGTGRIWPNQFMVMDPAGNQVGGARHPHHRADLRAAGDLGRRRPEGGSLAEGLHRGRRRHRAVDPPHRTAQEQHVGPVVLWRGAETAEGPAEGTGRTGQGHRAERWSPISGIQRVLQLLLAERISIRDLSTILEGIADALAFSRNPATMVEHVRARLARQICAQNTSHNGYLPLIALSAKWEQAFAESLIGQGEERSLAMQPSKLSEFMTVVRDRFEQAAREGEAPVLVTSAAIRPFVRSLVERFRSQTTVLSQAEIHPRARLKTVGSV